MRSLDDQKNRRILVIDDNRAIHDDFRKILVPGGKSDELISAENAFFGATTVDTNPQLEIEIDTADQGKSGLKKVIAAVAENRPYALAFVDMRMPPGWDGLTTIKELWKADPDLQVVICSAYSDNSWSDICQRLGATDRLLILKKPFDNAEVCQLAAALTHKWDLTQRARLKQVDLERLVEKRTGQLRESEASLRQKQKLEAIGSLAGGIAHEINNQLQVIRGYSRFAMDALPAEEQAYDDLTHIVEATDSAAAITGQLLRFSRRETAEKTTRDVNDIVKSTLTLARPLLGERIELDVKLCQEHVNVQADGDAISQALLNLCINARDAMPSGGRLMISTVCTELADRRGRTGANNAPNLKPGSYVVFDVTDTGCGMPAEISDRIFDPFFTTKEVGKGTGLGLAMVFGAAQDHDGTITVESTEGQGTTFKIYLPVVGVPASITTGAIGRDDSPLRAGDETILLVEDDPMVRNVTGRVLREAGYSVIEAIDGEDAVKQFQEHEDTIQLAVMDVVMPKLNGHEALERIKKRRPAIKAVFCTGYDPETAHTESLDNEAISTIYKPLTPETLLDTVRQLLDREPSCQAV